MTDPNVAAPSAPTIPSGWYPDPYADGVDRFWTGRSWTEHVRDATLRPATSPSAPPPTLTDGGDSGRRKLTTRDWLLIVGSVLVLGPLGPFAVWRRGNAAAVIGLLFGLAALLVVAFVPLHGLAEAERVRAEELSGALTVFALVWAVIALIRSIWFGRIAAAASAFVVAALALTVWVSVLYGILSLSSNAWDIPSMEAELPGLIDQAYGVSVLSVDCPDFVATLPGGGFECVVEPREGATRTLAITDTGGFYEWELVEEASALGR